jgi:PhzF family phenazine biosynthesis protein
VVVSAKPIETATAQGVAATLSVPTTGFVVASEAGSDRPAPVRFFTPQQEIDACGHVTIAIATALVEHGVWEWSSEVAISCRGGEYRLQLNDGQVEMEQRLQVREPAAVDWADVVAALGVSGASNLPLAISGTGLRHLIVPAAGVDDLAALRLERERIAALASRVGVDTICVFASTGHAGHFRVRDLCAGIGAVEEPASGTTSAALAFYLADHDLLTRPEVVIEQGIEMARPSRIEVLVEAADRVVVRGRAHKLLAGELELDVERNW